MRTRDIGLILFAWQMIGHSTQAADPTVADLIKMAPVIQSLDPDVKTLEMVGSIRMAVGRVRFRAVYRAPDHYAMLFRDGSDDTPLAFISDQRGLLYTPSRGSLFLMGECCPQMSLWSTDEKNPCMTLGFGPVHKKGKQLSLLRVDADGLCDLKAAEKRVLKDSDTLFRLYQKREDGGSTVCFFDLSRPQKFVAFKSFSPGELSPDLSIDRLVVDGPLADEEFRFPDLKAIPKDFAVLEMPNIAKDPLSSTNEVVTMFFWNTQVRYGATHPAARSTPALTKLGNVDWEAVRRNDLKHSATLRELFPIDLPESPGTDKGRVANGATTPNG